MPHRNPASAHIVTKVPIVSPNTTVGEVKRLVSRNIRKYRTIYYIYLLDEHKRLVGVVSFKHMLRMADKTKLSQITPKRVTVSHPNVNMSRIAHLAIMHNIKAIPIVDEEKHFLGVVPADTILDELYKEHRKHVYRSAGIVTPQDYVEDTLSENIIESFLHRIPWIMTGLVGGLIIARIVGTFETVLEQNLVLAAFIPLIVYISSAVGTQTQILFIRDLVINHKLPIVRYALKQAVVSIFIAICCSAFIWTVIYLFWGDAYIGVVISIAVLLAVATSTIVALTVPYTLNLVKQDPANGSGPFGTILQDFLSIVIYFSVATLLL